MQHDFDFLFGRWQVKNRRLRERLAGSTQWDEFDARVECRPVLGGLGNCETFETDWNGGYRGMALAALAQGVLAAALALPLLRSARTLGA